MPFTTFFLFHAAHQYNIALFCTSFKLNAYLCSFLAIASLCLLFFRYFASFIYTTTAVNNCSPIDSPVSLWSCRLQVSSTTVFVFLNLGIISYLDNQVVAHGHYYRCRRTAQPSVVQYSMLDVSCPTGNFHQISSFDRLKRSASSRYKKYQKNLVFKHSTKKNYSQLNLFNNSLQSWQW